MQFPQNDRWGEIGSHNHTLLTYDRWGIGLSDRNRTDFSLEAEIQDLGAIIAHLKLDRVTLYGQHEGGVVAMAYAARYPEQVSHLILENSFARGEDLATEKMRSALISLVSAHWGAASRTLAELQFPGADTVILEIVTKMIRECITPECAVKFMEYIYQTDVTTILPDIKVPTLVMHCNKYRVVPFRLGRELAALIPDCMFVPIEGDLPFPFCKEPSIYIQTILKFLGDPVISDPVKDGKAEGAESEMAQESSHDVFISFAFKIRRLLLRFMPI